MATFPKSSLEKIRQKSSNEFDSRRQRMLSDPDFYIFSMINARRPSSATCIWKIPFTVFEIELCKFIVKLWILS